MAAGRAVRSAKSIPIRMTYGEGEKRDRGQSLDRAEENGLDLRMHGGLPVRGRLNTDQRAYPTARISLLRR